MKTDRFLERTVTVVIDRPVETHAPAAWKAACPIHCGHLAGSDGPGVYLLGVGQPGNEFTGLVTAVLHRRSGTSQLVVVPAGLRLHQAQIAERLSCLERDFTLSSLYQKSAGAMVFRRKSGRVEFLLLLQMQANPHTWSFPKGHMEMGEEEEDTARREIFEESGLRPRLLPEFRTEIHYRLGNGWQKAVALFLAEAAGEPQLDGREIGRFRWEPPEEAKRLLHPACAAAIDNALAFLAAASQQEGDSNAASI